MASGNIREMMQIRLPQGIDRWRAIGIGFFLIAPAHGLYYSALPMTSTGESTVLNTTGPIWTALLAFLILREVVGPRRWLAIGIGTLGSYFVAVGFSAPNLVQGHTAGNMIYLLGTLLETLAMILAIKVIKASSGPGALAYELIGASISFALMPFIIPERMQLSVAQVTPSAIGAMAYLVLIAGLFCFGVWYRLAEKAPVSLMVVSLGLQAPFGAFLGWWVRGEQITAATAVGTVLILTALCLAATEAKESPVPDSVSA